MYVCTFYVYFIFKMFPSDVIILYKCMGISGIDLSFIFNVWWLHSFCWLGSCMFRNMKNNSVLSWLHYAIMLKPVLTILVAKLTMLAVHQYLDTG